MNGPTGTVLTVSPHPDDETLGVGATMSMLVDAGWRMVNLACSLGHTEDHPRRRAELAEAGRRLGFETVEMAPLAKVSRTDDLHRAAADVADAVTAMCETYVPDVVVSPHLADGHHAHEAVAAGVRIALERSTNGPVWWQYGIWADLPFPNVFVPYGEDTMTRISDVIGAYAGENDRSNYDLMYPARAVVARTLGSERVFGFGSSTATDLPYADLITEVRHTATGWQFADPRLFAVSAPLAATWGMGDASVWLNAPTPREQWSRLA